MTDLILETEAEAAIETPRSVVAAAYKRKYAEREAAMTRRPKGVSRKALARSSGDWLAIELAKLTLDEKSRLVMSKWNDVLEANGLSNKWTHLNPGQQKMLGRLALQRVVAEDGELVLPDGATMAAPRAWVQKHQH